MAPRGVVNDKHRRFANLEKAWLPFPAKTRSRKAQNTDTPLQEYVVGAQKIAHGGHEEFVGNVPIKSGRYSSSRLGTERESYCCRKLRMHAYLWQQRCSLKTTVNILNAQMIQRAPFARPRKHKLARFGAVCNGQ